MCPIRASVTVYGRIEKMESGKTHFRKIRDDYENCYHIYICSRSDPAPAGLGLVAYRVSNKP